MRHLRFWLIALMFLPAIGCTGATPPEPLFIAQLLPLTGPDQLRGAEARLGARLAVEEALTENVRYQGRPFQIRHVDDRHDREVARAETARLLAVNRVPALLGMLNPDLSETMIRVAAPSGVPTLVPGDILELPLGDAIFPFGTASTYRGRILAQFAASEIKAKKAAVLIDNQDPIAASLAAAFLTEWRASGDRAVGEWSFDRAAQGPAALLPLAELLQSKPDVVLLAAEPATFVRLRQEAARMESKAPLLYGGADLGQSALPRHTKTPTAYCATIYCVEALSERGKQFVAKYEKEMHAPPDLAAAQAYDGTRLLIEAIAKVGITPTTLRDYLTKLEAWETVTGPLSLKDRHPKRPVFVLRLDDDKPQRVKEYARE